MLRKIPADPREKCCLINAYRHSFPRLFSNLFCARIFPNFFSNFGFLGLASRLGPSRALEISPTACLGRSIEWDAVPKARERFRRSPRHGDGGGLKSQLSSVDIVLPIPQNLDGSVLVINNTPCNTTIVSEAEILFFGTAV